MQGRRTAFFLTIFICFEATASQQNYEYTFVVEGEAYRLRSINEVMNALAGHGPEYGVLRISEEQELSETKTLLVFSAPDPVAVPGLTFWYAFEWYGEEIGGYELSRQAAEAAMTAKLVSRGRGAPVHKYSGHWRDSGNAYHAYHDYVPIPANLIVDPTYPVSGWCGDYTIGNEIAYGSARTVVVFTPALKTGHICGGQDGQIWRLEGFGMQTITEQPGYFCPAGYLPEWTPIESWCSNAKIVHVYRDEATTCPVDPLIPLDDLIAEYHQNDPHMAQLTRDLEAGVNVPLRDMLVPAAQEAEACVSSKFAISGFDYQLESTGRPKAYQAHFYDLFQRWLEHGNVTEDSPEWEACAELREQVELEVGKRVGTEGKIWNAIGGRFHQIIDAASAETSKHPDGKAFDVSGVDAVMDYLGKDGPPTLTVEDWVNDPTDCNAGWGGLYTRPDNVHFYLREGEQQMELLALIAAVTAGMQTTLPPDLHSGEPQWARLLVSGEHVDGDIVYHYTVINQHPDEELIHLTLGVYYEEGGAVPDLVEKPIGTEVIVEPDPQQPGFNRFWANMPESAWTAPPHWMLDFVKLEYYPRFYLKFWLQGASKRASVGEVQPGHQLEGFSIRLPKADQTYYETGFEASFYYPAGQYFGYPEKLDTAAPELSVSVSRPDLWPPNNKLVDINANIEATDDYDGQPAITLVSITANEPLEESDIQGAEFGTDDRSFQLRASRDGMNQEGRIYTITYSAEDAFGHATERSATVTVPHDRR